MTALPHARCAVCHFTYAVRKNGTMREHRPFDTRLVCPGSGGPPARVALAAHLEQIHLYDFGAADAGADDFDALRLLHRDLHVRGDVGLFRHPLSSWERAG